MDSPAAQELEAIRAQGGGILKPDDVVRRAKGKNNPLHKYFTWDDTAAAREYRLWQARELIRVHVRIESPGQTFPTRVYVSLDADRQGVGGGYRHIDDVLSDVDLRGQLLDQADRDFRYWEAKYSHLKELAAVIKSMDRVRAGRGKKSKAE
jgi:hypothetical protein